MVIKAPKANSADDYAAVGLPTTLVIDRTGHILRGIDGELSLAQMRDAVGPALAADLRLMGFEHPAELRGQDAFALYRRLCEVSGQRQDPCVLDTFMAITDFMRGAAAAPWWNYTAQRKATFGAV